MDKLSYIIEKIIEISVSLGPLGAFLLIMIEPFLPVIPIGIIIGINMLSYGTILGFLLSYIAAICGALLSFCLFRYFIKEKIIHLFSKKNQEKINEWMNKVTEINFASLVVIYALPITPAFAVNIAAGLSNITLRKYLLALLIGKPALILFYGTITVSVVESLSDPISLIKIFILVLGAYILSKIIEKVVKVEK